MSMAARFVDLSRYDSIHARFQVQSDFICNGVRKMWIPWIGKQINIVQYDELAF